MSRLAHSNDETMAQIETNRLREDGYTEAEIERLQAGEMVEGDWEARPMDDGLGWEVGYVVTDPEGATAWVQLGENLDEETALLIAAAPGYRATLERLHDRMTDGRRTMTEDQLAENTEMIAATLKAGRPS